MMLHNKEADFYQFSKSRRFQFSLSIRAKNSAVRNISF